MPEVPPSEDEIQAFINQYRDKEGHYSTAFATRQALIAVLTIQNSQSKRTN